MLSETRAPEHTSVYCDECGKSPLRGLRYKCGHCEAYDLCECCFRYTRHAQDHVFLVLRQERDDARGPLLRQALPLAASSMFSITGDTPRDNPLGLVLLEKQEKENQRPYAPLNRAFHAQQEPPFDPTVRRQTPLRFGEPFVVPAQTPPAQKLPPTFSFGTDPLRPDAAPFGPRLTMTRAAALLPSGTYCDVRPHNVDK